MIFVTVGTHEDPFDRLIMEIDTLKRDNKIKDSVFIQSGYSNYLPRFCEYKAFLTTEEMDQRISTSTKVITHGGPGSILHALRYQKIPIVVPRQSKFKEHVDNHQVLFVQRLEVLNRIFPIYDISNLEKILAVYEDEAKRLEANAFTNSNLPIFIKRLENITHTMLEKQMRLPC